MEGEFGSQRLLYSDRAPMEFAFSGPLKKNEKQRINFFFKKELEVGEGEMRRWIIMWETELLPIRREFR